MQGLDIFGVVDLLKCLRIVLFVDMVVFCIMCNGVLWKFYLDVY